MKGRIYLLILCAIVACKHNSEENKTKQKTTSTKYAQGFSIENYGIYRLVYVFDLNTPGHDTIGKYQLFEGKQNLNQKKGFTYVQIPLQSIVVLSSLYVAQLYELGELRTLKAVDQAQYQYNNEVQKKIAKNEIKELGSFPNLNFEVLFAIAPQLVLTYGGAQKQNFPQLNAAHIPLAFSYDYKENSPLARAEWIKFIATFFNKDAIADSIFNKIEADYLALSQLSSSIKERPKVLSELLYSDSWYVPAGASFMAKMLKDAGMDYFWKSDSGSGSLHLNFEQVFAKAHEADIWLQLHNCKSKADVLQKDQRYQQFKAFKNGMLFNNNARTNAVGANDYWESGMQHPERILADLLYIAHPELLPQHKLFYYQQLH